MTSAASSASAERVHAELVWQRLVREHQRSRVGEKNQQKPGDEGEGQPQRGEQRRKHRIDDGDRGRYEDRRLGVQQRDPGSSAAAT